MHDISDNQLGRIILVCSAVGVVVLFAVTVTIGLLAGLSFGQAAAAAGVPTFFGGWFYGGVVFLLRAADSDVTKEHPAARPARDQIEYRPARRAA